MTKKDAKRSHKMQHPDSPTWCVICGTFDIYCDTTPCSGEGDDFNFNKPENYVRNMKDLFGDPSKLAPARAKG